MDERPALCDQHATDVSLPVSVLVVEDSSTDALLVKTYLREDTWERFAVSVVPTLAEAIAAIRAFEPDCVVTDLGLPDADGLEVVRALHHTAPLVPIVVLSGRDDEDIAIDAIAHGAQDYILKNGMSGPLLGRVIRYAIERQRMTNDASSLAAIVTSSHDAIISIRLDGTITSWNNAAEGMYGYAASEAVGERISMIVPDDRRAEHHAMIERLAGGARVARIETQRVRKDGSIVDVDLTVSPIHAATGELVGLSKTARDITARKQTDNELRFQAKLLDSVGQAVIATDVAGRITYWNRAAEALYGWHRDEVVGRPIAEVTPADTTRDQADEIVACLARGETWAGEFTCRRKDGSLVPVLVTDTPVYDNGDLVAIIGVSTDVSERVAAQAALARAEEEYRRLFTGMPHPMWVFDAETLRFAAVNDAAVAHYGYSRDEFLTMTIADIRPAEDVDRLHESLQGSAEERSRPTVWRHRKKDGTAIDVEVVSHDQEFDGRPARMVVATDVTERLQAERALAESEKRYRTVVEVAAEAVIVTDADGVVTFANGRATDMFGYEREQLVGMHITQLVAPECHDAMRERIVRRSRGISERYEVQFVRADGERGWLSASVAPLMADGHHVASVGLMTDITAQRHAQMALAESEAHLRATIETANDAFVAVDLDGVIRDWNARAETLFGWGRDEVIGRSLVDVLVPLDTRERWSSAFADIDPDSPYDVRVEATEFTSVNRDGDEFPVEVTAWAVVVEGETWLCAFVRDIRERKALEEELRRQALEDPLTGLPNRTLLMDRLEQALARSRRDGSGPAVLFLDLDRFKYVNDALGHSAGDALLQAVARRLVERCRNSDTVARYGGDEFVVIADGVDSEYDAIVLGEQLTQALEPPLAVNGREVFATASVGVSIAAKTSTPESLLRDADAAMYIAKEKGRARAELTDQMSRYRAEARLLAETALRHAVDRGEFRVLYQPVVSMRDHTVVGAEALVRWQHPGGDFVSPADFIPLAEETGLIVPIGEFVLEQACEQLRRVCELAPGIEFTMAVNLSARQVMSPGLVDHLAELLLRTGVHPGRLTLEITESTLMADVDYFVEQLTSLKRLGVRLAVDDFGTGYSSLAYLKRFPMDVIKIDRSFVKGMVEHPADSAIVGAMIVMARALKLSVVGEGVETEAEADGLRVLGCDYGQGFLWSKPVPIDDVLAMLPVPTPARRAGPFRAVVVDDLAEHRVMLRLELEHAGGFEVVGEACDATSAVDVVSERQPDLILLDMAMPGESGLDALPRLLAACPSARVVLISSHVYAELSEEAIATGASIVLDKAADAAALGSRLREMMAGA